ncbi:MAG TPA: hypothetical protein VGN48_13985 [Pedococcus sp.]|nr:hypothetical protein [Pedococcus sp.]
MTELFDREPLAPVVAADGFTPQGPDPAAGGGDDGELTAAGAPATAAAADADTGDALLGWVGRAALRAAALVAVRGVGLTPAVRVGVVVVAVDEVVAVDGVLGAAPGLAAAAEVLAACPDDPAGPNAPVAKAAPTEVVAMTTRRGIASRLFAPSRRARPRDCGDRIQLQCR